MCVCIDIHRLEADDSVIAERTGCVFAAVEVVVEEPIGQQHWDDWQLPEPIGGWEMIDL